MKSVSKNPVATIGIYAGILLLLSFAEIGCHAGAPLPAMSDPRPTLWKRSDLHFDVGGKSDFVVSVYRSERLVIEELTVSFGPYQHHIEGSELKFLIYPQVSSITAVPENVRGVESVTLTVPYYDDDPGKPGISPKFAHITITSMSKHSISR